MNPIKTKSNFRKLYDGLYLVRTQAGFKQACNDYTGHDDDHEVEGYPTSYPSIVRFVDAYKGCLYTYIQCSHVNKYKKHLLSLYDNIKDE